MFLFLTLKHANCLQNFHDEYDNTSPRSQTTFGFANPSKTRIFLLPSFGDGTKHRNYITVERYFCDKNYSTAGFRFQVLSGGRALFTNQVNALRIETTCPRLCNKRPIIDLPANGRRLRALGCYWEYLSFEHWKIFSLKKNFSRKEVFLEGHRQGHTKNPRVNANRPKFFGLCGST